MFINLTENTSDTTNICDLPIVSTQPVSGEEGMRQMPLSTQSIQQDPNIVKEHQGKKVRFNDESINSNMTHKNEPYKQIQNNNFTVLLEHKIIILATFSSLYLVILNSKYILNILVQIFGTYLKTDTGHLSKIGMFVYSFFMVYYCLYALQLLTLLLFIWHLSWIIGISIFNASINVWQFL